MPFELVIFTVLFLLGYFVGSANERKHYKSIEAREQASLQTPVTTLKSGYAAEDVVQTRLAVGGVVISIDYFKWIVSILRNLVGGSVGSYESLVDRARREAILRMKENAPGAAMIINVRVETSTIADPTESSRTIGAVEALAYGTAIWTSEKPAIAGAA